MKILVVNPILFTHADGVIPSVDSIKDTLMYQMCLGFTQLGHDVTLAASADYEPQVQEIYDFDVLWFKSSYRKLLPPTILPYSKEFEKYIKEKGNRYDMILSKEVFSLYSLIVAKYYPQKVILWVEQAQHQRKFFKLPSRIVFNIIGKFYMGKTNQIVPCSKAAYDFLVKYFNNTNPTIIEHGINLEKFVPSNNKKRQVITSSQLIKRKNIDGIIREFAEFHNTYGYEDVRLLIAGRGPEESVLKNLVKELSIEENVEFLGFLSQKELGAYVAESLAFLIKTHSDLNMVSVPESICSGTPLLMNSIPLTAWYVSNKSLGIVNDNWGKNELKEIIDNNGYYVKNCINYRGNLSITASAQSLVSVLVNPNK